MPVQNHPISRQKHLPQKSSHKISKNIFSIQLVNSIIYFDINSVYQAYNISILLISGNFSDKTGKFITISKHLRQKQANRQTNYA
ncbi:hypothetical protein BHC47_02650 [Snodgrassella alvi]|uniref:Uncharacterized protein n=1 Tax=Snodgrassella alvi TaxID=1196083 RepID=A0A2N9Y682_9NEIS|nr:hypothetical protein BHC47_02650 [Snodgrassella alvi]PIT65993.1 hypothetical protein BHC56_03540 [Snodgrassella alvi]